MKRYLIRDRETGTAYMDSFDTLEEAEKRIEEYEEDDKNSNSYSYNFYEIFDNEKQEIL